MKVPTCLELEWRKENILFDQEEKAGRLLLAVNCSRAQAFYSLIVLNVPCWHSQGMLQRLDPIAVWVYGLRCRSGGLEAYQDMQSQAISLPSSQRFSARRRLCRLCAPAFLIMTYINMKRAHIFCCRYRQTLRAFHWREALFEAKRGLLAALCEPVGKCLLCLVGEKKKKGGTKNWIHLNFLYCFFEPLSFLHFEVFFFFRNIFSMSSQMNCRLWAQLSPETRDENGR